jgi:hypothetical protein
VRHGAYLTKLTPSENAELNEIADEIRKLTPADSPSVEPAVGVLASLIWRQRRLLTFLDEHGFIRGGLTERSYSRRSKRWPWSIDRSSQRCRASAADHGVRERAEESRHPAPWTDRLRA